MITTLAGLYATAAAGLGGYNIARFFAVRAIRKRRERRKQRKRDAAVAKVVDFGIRNEDAVKQVLAAFETKYGGGE